MADKSDPASIIFSSKVKAFTPFKKVVNSYAAVLSCVSSASFNFNFLKIILWAVEKSEVTSTIN